MEGTMNDTKSLMAEAFGTFWLVLGGCGTAVLAGAGVGTLGISLAFGLTVLTMAYAVGHVSGGHFNPAVTVGLWAGGRFPANRILPYVAAQVVGAIVAAFVLLWIAKGMPGWALEAGKLASNGVAEHSPGKYSLAAGFVTEVVMTAFFLIAIGLALVLIHLISIPVTNTSVNPARSTGPALVEGGIALQQLWVFWLAPLVGGALGGWAYRELIAGND
jgi:aquaporin Z